RGPARTLGRGPARTKRRTATAARVPEKRRVQVEQAVEAAGRPSRALQTRRTRQGARHAPCRRGKARATRLGTSRAAQRSRQRPQLNGDVLQPASRARSYRFRWTKG